MIFTRLLVGLAVIATLALPGCTSRKSDLTVVTAGKLVKTAIRPPKLKLDPVKLSRTAQKALASTGPDEPLATIQFPSVKGQSVLRVIETNGPHSTWAAWGTSDRRTITTKNGIITATRAIPPDLMSADVDGVLALVSRRGQITGKMLRDHFHLPLHTVAKKFGMCTTAFKKLCRRFEIPKWPHRQVECPFPTPRPARRERVLRGLPHADACSGRAAAGDR